MDPFDPTGVSNYSDRKHAAALRIAGGAALALAIVTSVLTVPAEAGWHDMFTKTTTKGKGRTQPAPTTSPTPSPTASPTASPTSPAPAPTTPAPAPTTPAPTPPPSAPSPSPTSPAPAPTTPAPAPTTPAPAPTTPAPAPTTPAPAPTTPAPSPTSPAPSPSPSPAGRDTASAGAATLGSTSYPIPAGALFVSPSGSDTNAGTQAAPVRTIARAVTLAASGGTVVLRAGTYHENVTIPSTKRLTVQNFPGEVVWLDGSSVVTGWAASGSVWVKDGWNTVFDHSPTYTRGASDSTQANWGFVNPSYPMAAHPDQVFVDSTALTQVGSLSEVTAGKFYFDEANSKLYVGSNPSGHTVTASTLNIAMTVQSGGSIIRGFGVTKYAPSVPDMGAVRLTGSGITAENLVITNSATTGISAMASNITLNHVTSLYSGMLGMHANYADGLRVLGVRASSNNVEHFNSSPVSGGLKITRSRGEVVKDSVFNNNFGPGVWFDESVYDITIAGSDMLGNASHGISLELSAKATVVDNLIGNNSGNGIKVNNTSDVSVWNNTFMTNGRNLNLVQDSRDASNLSTPGHDPRQSLPDPTVTWQLGPISVGNNVFAFTGSGGNCLLCVEDYTHTRTAEQIGVAADGDVYNRMTTSAPSWVTVWSNGAGNPKVFTSLSAFVTGTGQDTHGWAKDGSAVIDSAGHPTSTLTAAEPTTAQAIPSRPAGVAGVATGTKHLGAWF